MARGDWFRNEEWTATVEAGFRTRLRLARDKAQPLRIQAEYLAERHPQASLGLLDEYLAIGERFDLAAAHVTKAHALMALGDPWGAVAAYEAALAREREFPNLRTRAWLELPWLVLEAGLLQAHPHALRVLDANWHLMKFPVDRYQAHGARALLWHGAGRTKEAAAEARLALAAAGETQSGFRSHPRIGLVTEADDRLGRDIAALAGSSPP